MSETTRETVIRCEGVWKIFGDMPRDALDAVLTQRMSKEEIRDRYDCIVGVRDASFSVARGEIFCIMGLSGSGKSTLIRHINRLIEPTAGSILIEGEDVNALSARDLRRLRAEKIGMVFQNMALMPHRTVLENVGFSQEVRGHDLRERNSNALRAIEAVDLKGWENKYPDELSGGMQQRVGLARAIAADPTILLMDEPFSALDPLIRRQLQEKFMTLSAEMKKTTLFITHDLDEAIRIGDRIAIMKDGALLQVGSPKEIYEKPESKFAADFIGVMNFLHVKRTADGFATPDGTPIKTQHVSGDVGEGEAIAAVRPERLSVGEGGDNHFEGVVAEIAYHGLDLLLHVKTDLSDTPVIARMTADVADTHQPEIGQRITLSWLARDTHIFPA